MPGRDGTGPLGQGQARGNGMRRGARGMGYMASAQADFCVCPQCGEKVPHQPGVPCSSLTCPKCGGKMIRG